MPNGVSDWVSSQPTPPSRNLLLIANLFVRFEESQPVPSSDLDGYQKAVGQVEMGCVKQQQHDKRRPQVNGSLTQRTHSNIHRALRMGRTFFPRLPALHPPGGESATAQQPSSLEK